MKINMRKITLSLMLLLAVVVVAVPFERSGDAPEATANVDTSTASYIVQGNSSDSVAAIVRSVGGDITHELGVIRSVAARSEERV